MVVNPYEKYKKASVETANQGKLILMLYEGAIRFLNIALEALSQKILDKTNNNIIKAQDIIWELLGSLDLDKGGEIAENLFRLYDYMNRRLVHANIKKEPEGIHEVIALLQDLKSAWEVVFKEQTSSGMEDVKQPQGGNVSFER